MFINKLILNKLKIIQKSKNLDSLFGKRGYFSLNLQRFSRGVSSWEAKVRNQLNK
jgi:hypothetical protein